MARIAGIDEAGRGPVIGPMVMAIVACEDTEQEQLARAGIKDSKLLSPERRESLFELASSFAHEIIELSPADIDRAVLGKHNGDNLNLLEARATAQLIYLLAQRTDLTRVIIDSPTRTTAKHERDVRLALDRIDMKGRTRHIVLQCEIKADANHPIVGAASILAKVTRDHAIARIEQEHGAIGSGYPSDPITQQFLYAHWREEHDFFRKSWESYARLARDSKSHSGATGQSSLFSFGDSQELQEETQEERALEHKKTIKAFEVLKEHGFTFVPPTNQYEIVRMKNNAGVTVIVYTTRKVVVQGNTAAETNSLLERLGLLDGKSVEHKRPRGRPKKS